MTEDRCLAEEKASYLTPFLPLSTNLPPKSGLRPDRDLDGQPAQPNSQLAYGSRVHLNHQYAPINHKGFAVSRTGNRANLTRSCLGRVRVRESRTLALRAWSRARYQTCYARRCAGPGRTAPGQPRLPGPLEPIRDEGHYTVAGQRITIGS